MICADILSERSRLSPDRTALVEVATGRRFSYRELDHRASVCARAWLYGLGLKRGDRIGILSANCVEFVESFFAAAKSGVILVPLGTRLTAAELAVIVEDCSLSALIYGGEHAQTVTVMCALVDPGRLVPVGEASKDGEISWSDLMATVGATDFLPGSCDPYDPLCLL